MSKLEDATRQATEDFKRLAAQMKGDALPQVTITMKVVIGGKTYAIERKANSVSEVMSECAKMISQAARDIEAIS